MTAHILHRITAMSLRARVLVIATALLAVGQAVGSTVLIGALEHYLIGRTDSQLRPAARVASRTDAHFWSSVPRDAPGSFLWGNFLAHLDPDGVVRRSARSGYQPGVSDPRLPRLDTATVAARAGTAVEVPEKDGSGRWRAIALPRDLEGSPDSGSVVVAASLHEVDATIAQLRTLCLLVGASLLVGLTVVGALAVRAGLRPLRRVEETAAAIAFGDLSRRVPDLAAPHTEVGRLAAALNSMLVRNETAFAARARSEARMRRFVADASHELRTPLVGIRAYTTLYRMGALDERADVDRTMARIERESQRMTRLVEDLLLLARLDEHQNATPDGEFPLQLAPMDLRTLAVDALHDVRAIDPTRPVRLSGPDGGPPAAAPALADETWLRQVMINLIGNALTHTPAGTAVCIGVGTVNGHAVLEVADEGPGLTDDQAQRVFDRFYRADGSRTRARGGGAGLGLSIVHALVSAHGGHVELRSAAGKGAAFRVLLPALTDGIG